MTSQCCFSDLFEYIMEAPKSLKQKEGEAPMCYINKGKSVTTSVVAVCFKCTEETVSLGFRLSSDLGYCQNL